LSYFCFKKFKLSIFLILSCYKDAKTSSLGPLDSINSLELLDIFDFVNCSLNDSSKFLLFLSNFISCSLCILNSLSVILVGEPYSSNLLDWCNIFTESGLMLGMPGALDVDMPAKNGSRLVLVSARVAMRTGLFSDTNVAGTASFEWI